MRKKIKIGEKEFLTKKEALSHYKVILNSYDFGESINEQDFFEKQLKVGATTRNWKTVLKLSELSKN